MDEAALQALITKTANEAATNAVNRTMLTLGIDPSAPIESQKDFAALRDLRGFTSDPETQKDLIHLRRWRTAMEQAQNKSFMAAMGLLVMGGLGLILYSIRSQFTAVSS